MMRAALDVVRRKNAELADLAETAAVEAERLLANAKRALRAARKKAADLAAAGGKDAAAGRRRGRLARAVNDLTSLLAATRRIAAQTRQRITGVTPDGASRRVRRTQSRARWRRRQPQPRSSSPTRRATAITAMRPRAAPACLSQLRR